MQHPGPADETHPEPHVDEIIIHSSLNGQTLTTVVITQQYGTVISNIQQNEEQDLASWLSVDILSNLHWSPLKSLKMYGHSTTSTTPCMFCYA